MRRVVRVAAALLFASLLLAGPALADHQDEEPPPGVLEERTVAFEGSDERYLLYIPASYDGSESVPLVVVFRGSNTPAEAMLRVGLNDEADDAGFLVVYPDLERVGTGPVWSAFLTQLVDAIEREFDVDPRRVYVAGFSRGAAVTHRIACELADRVAAVAAVDAAPLPVGPSTLDVRGLTFTCDPARPLAVLHFHGTQSGQSPYFNARALIPFWAETNGCGLQPRETIIEVAGERVIREAYSGCAEGADVILYSVEGGVHAWPGAPRGPDDLPLGANEEEPASSAVIATPLIWRFFERHPMP